MKIVISAEGVDLEAKVAHRFRTARNFVIVDLEIMDLEAVQTPVPHLKRGSGMQGVVVAVNKGIKAVLRGYRSPVARGHTFPVFRSQPSAIS